MGGELQEQKCLHLDDEDIQMNVNKEKDGYALVGFCELCMITGIKYCPFCGKKIFDGD